MGKAVTFRTINQPIKLLFHLKSLRIIVQNPPIPPKPAPPPLPQHYRIPGHLLLPRDSSALPLTVVPLLLSSC